MRIIKHQHVPRYPALKVRAFLFRYRVGMFVELLPKVAEEAEFRKCCDRRPYAAREQGTSFSRRCSGRLVLPSLPP